MLQPFPQYDASLVVDGSRTGRFTEWLKQAIVAVRNIRAEVIIALAKLAGAVAAWLQRGW